MIAQLGRFSRDLARGLLDLLYPGTCLLCGGPLESNRPAFCATCRAALTSDALESCPRCAATIGPFAVVDGGCTRCRGEVFHFDQAIRLGVYEGLLREAILRLKHIYGEHLAEALGNLWAQAETSRFSQLKCDLIIPVALHWKRRWGRGYNQSQDLAAALASHLRLPCRPRLLRRIRNTPHQTQQTPTNRRENLLNAFQAVPQALLSGKSVLLVDDVLTTGSTSSEAAKALKRAGAGRVVVAVLARAEV